MHPVKIYLFRGDDEANQGEGGGPERYLCRGRVIRYLVTKLGQNPRLNSWGGDDEFVDRGWCDGDGFVQVSPDFGWQLGHTGSFEVARKRGSGLDSLATTI